MNPVDQPLTVIVRRVVRRGREMEFEAAMRAFIDESMSFPGSSDFHVIRPGPSAPHEYTVSHRFQDEAARRAFVDSPMYARWMQQLRGLTEGDPLMEEFSGIAGWFTLPGGQPAHGPPPRVKMAAVTFIGVYPLTSTLPRLGMSAMPGVHPLVVNAVVTAAIVGLLTWVVMPALTRVFAGWLFRPAGSREESAQ